MEDLNSPFSEASADNTTQSAEEQPTALISPTSAATEETSTDDVTVLAPSQISTPAAEASDRSASTLPQASSEQETISMANADAPTILNTPENVQHNSQEAMAAQAQAYQQPAGNFAAAPTTPDIALAGAAFAQQSPEGYPSAGAYVPDYAQAGYPSVGANAQPGYSQALYLQPSVPLPLQPGQPGLTVPPRKRRIGLWVALIIALLVVLGGGAALALAAAQRPTNTPTQVLEQFCHGYKTLNAQEVYDTLSTASKGGTSLAQLQRSFDELRSLSSFVKISDCKVSNIHENGSTATGTITLLDTISFGDITSTTSVPMSMGLVLENNTWKVDITKMDSNLTMPTPTFLTPTVPGSSNQ